MKGAVERVLRMCSRYSHFGAPLPMSNTSLEHFLADASSLGRQGLRGSLVHTLLSVSSDMRFAIVLNIIYAGISLLIL